ncbi:MAG TPA: type VI secretion system baseplate subunit TssE [Steroidobacteraceae bacterium]|jgi:type VI secretion system protein ImpF
MAELSLRERLQPALIDRLIDEDRLTTLFEVTFRTEELKKAGLAERELADILQGQGLRLVGEAGAASAARVPHLTLASPGGRVTLSQLKNLLLKPPGAPKGVTVAALCDIAARNVLNQSVESGDSKAVSSRKLREYVCRDLASLLNSNSLDVSVDLGRFPEVQQSVLNYGMPSLAGRTARTVDPQQTAARIEAVIRRFEPRLSRVRVTPELREGGAEGLVLAFRIEAELWGHPAPQQLVLRTSIDVDSGDVSIADSK